MGRIRTHTNPFNFYKKLDPVDFDEVFPNYSGTIDMEIGFGRGVFVRSYAKNNPNKSILAMDIRKSVVDLLNERLEKEGIENVYLVHSTGERCVEDLIGEEGIENIFVFHPDPWIKKRHHKRRLINKEFLEILKTKTKPKGRLYLSTDVESLWESMNEQIEQVNFLKKIEDGNFWTTYYQTHWHEFSEKNGRSLFKGVFEFNP